MNILYLTYNGLTEPLGRRQVLPYIVGLARRGWVFRVLSFEKVETADSEAVNSVRGTLRNAGVEWRAMRYGRGSTLVKAFDILRGFVSVLRSREKALMLIHARSTVAAAMAAPAAACLGVPWIFDVRGLVAEEYVDAGHWPKGGVLHRVTQAVEGWLLRRADGLVFLTDRVRSTLREHGAISPRTPTEVIPCCTDLNVFRPNLDERRRIRTDLTLGASIVIVYSGSLGSWYNLEEMLAFFGVARRSVRGLHFLILSPQAANVRPVAERMGLAASITALSVRPEDVPAYLAAADVGVCFLQNVASKRASSPTKYAEYLATGLPVICDAWTGDNARLANHPAIVTIDSFSGDAYARAAGRLASLLSQPEETRAAHARGLAREQLSIEIALERYDRLYRATIGPQP